MASSGRVARYAAGPPATQGLPCARWPALSGIAKSMTFTATRSSAIRARPPARPRCTIASGSLSSTSRITAGVASAWCTGSTALRTTAGPTTRPSSALATSADGFAACSAKGSKPVTRITRRRAPVFGTGEGEVMAARVAGERLSALWPAPSTGPRLATRRPPRDAALGDGVEVGLVGAFLVGLLGQRHEPQVEAGCRHPDLKRGSTGSEEPHEVGGSHRKESHKICERHVVRFYRVRASRRRLAGARRPCLSSGAHEHRSGADRDGSDARPPGASRALSARPANHRAAVRAAVRRGPRRPSDARREPDQVAPGPRLVVLRDVPAGAQPARLRVPEPCISCAL